MVGANAWVMAIPAMAAFLLTGCGSPDSGSRNAGAVKKSDDNKVLNFYNWADYLAPDTIASFEQSTGIKVRVSYFETNETLEARMLTGNSGFDVVVPTAPGHCAHFQFHRQCQREFRGNAAAR